MRLIKRYIATIVAVCMLVGMTISFPMAAQAEEAKAENETINFLMDLGIYSAEDDMSLENDILTREKVASILSVFYGVSEESVLVDTPFADVSKYWASGHIMAMVSNGIMNGYQDGLFRPQATITMEELVKIFICMTGHKPLAEIKGGYPNGYVAEASRVGLLSGVTFDADAEVTKGMFTTLLSNAIKIPMTIDTAYGEYIDFVTDYDKTLLTEKLHIYHINGKVESVANAVAGYSNPVGVGRIAIGGYAYDCNFDAYDFLALDVDAYYRKTKADAVGEVLHINTKNRENDSVLIDSKDIVSASLTGVNYYVGNSRKTAKLDSTSLIVIFNGKKLANPTAEHLMPKQGNIRLVNADNKVGYEVVVVNYELDYLIKNISTLDGKITITDQLGKAPIEFNPDDENLFLKVTDKGAPSSYERLRVGQVITVLADSIALKKVDGTFNGINSATNTITINGASYQMVPGMNTFGLKIGNKYTFRLNENGEIFAYGGPQFTQDSKTIRIIRSTDIIEGKATQIKEKSIKIDGAEYGITSTLNKADITTTQTYKFYLNHRNEVTACEVKDEVSGKKYGLLLESAFGDEAFNTTLKIRVYTEDDEFVIYDVAPSLNIDGISYKNMTTANNALKTAATAFRNAINVDMGNWKWGADAATDVGVKVPDEANSIWQLVSFNVNKDNKINKIDTTTPNVKVEKTDLTYSDKCLEPGDTGMVQQNSTYVSRIGNSGNFDGRFGFSPESLCFVTIGDPNGKRDELGYKVYKGESTPAKIYGSVCFFNEDSEFNAYEVVLATVKNYPAKTLGAYTQNTNMIYQGVEYKMNAAGEFAPYIYGYSVDTAAPVTKEIESEDLLDRPWIAMAEVDSNIEGDATDPANFGTPVVPGDIIRWGVNKNGVANKIEKFISSEGGADAASKTAGNRGGYYITVRGCKGTIENIGDTFILLKYTAADGSFTYEPRLVSKIKNVLIFSRSTGEITIGSVSDIRSEKAFGVGDSFAGYILTNEFRTIVLYRP